MLYKSVECALLVAPVTDIGCVWAPALGACIHKAKPPRPLGSRSLLQDSAGGLRGAQQLFTYKFVGLIRVVLHNSGILHCSR